MECSHDKILVNELLGIYANEIRPKAQLAAAHALHLAVDRCKDMVYVTNEQHNVQVIESMDLHFKLKLETSSKLNNEIHCI